MKQTTIIIIILFWTVRLFLLLRIISILFAVDFYGIFFLIVTITQCGIFNKIYIWMLWMYTKHYEFVYR